MAIASCACVWPARCLAAAKMSPISALVTIAIIPNWVYPSEVRLERIEIGYLLALAARAPERLPSSERSTSLIGLPASPNRSRIWFSR